MRSLPFGEGKRVGNSAHGNLQLFYTHPLTLIKLARGRGETPSLSVTVHVARKARPEESLAWDPLIQAHTAGQTAGPGYTWFWSLTLVSAGSGEGVSAGDSSHTGILMSRTEGYCEQCLSSHSGHVYSLFSGLCSQVGLAGELGSSVCDFERYSTAPKSYLTSQPVCKSVLSCQCFLTKSKEDAASKGSSRCFQKHMGCKVGLASVAMSA